MACRFDKELCVSLPTVEQRQQLVHHLLARVAVDTNPTGSDALTHIDAVQVLSTQIAQATAGYTGNDIKTVCRTARLNAIARLLSNDSTTTSTLDAIQWQDVQRAIGEIRPQNLRVSNHNHQHSHATYTSDRPLASVVGCHAAKRAFAQTIQWQLQHAESLHRFGVCRQC
jgi:SpoVK/Ycf46/Vps4 family AAA+-type ATPase